MTPFPHSRLGTRKRRWAAPIAAGCLLAFVAGAAGAGDTGPSFAPGARIAVGPSPSSVAVADFNADGKPDAAVANSGDPGDIRILLGNGAGGFSPAGPPLATGQYPGPLTSADLNGDDKADLVVANRGSKDLSILLGNGAGDLAGAPGSPGSPVKLAGEPVDVAAADLNGDRKTDLAVFIYRSAKSLVAILLGDGSGRIAAASGSPFTVAGSHPSSLAVDDFNKDGKPDLALGDSESKKLSILLGRGGGGFGPATAVAGGYGAISIAVSDVNRDGKLDLAVGSQYSDRGFAGPRLTMLLGNGAGGFHAATGSPMAMAGQPSSIAVADFNADGKADLGIANGDPDNVTVLLGNGAGGFRLAADSPFAVQWPSQIVAGDFNSDGKPDLLALSRFRLAHGSPSAAGITMLFQASSAPAILRGRTLPARADSLLSTRGVITDLAADGNRVAVMTGRLKRTCGRVVVFTVPGRRSRSLTPGYLGCHGDGMRDVTLGDGQVAWIEEGGGNDLELTVDAAKISGGKLKQIDYASNSDRAGGDPSGDWVGQLLGGGPLLAYNAWAIRCNAPDGYSCSDYDPTLSLANEKVLRISAGRKTIVRSGRSSYPVSAVGGGRMAVESGGVVTVLSARGSLVSTLPAPNDDRPRAIALSATRLALQRPFALDLYSPTSGTKTKSIPLGAAAGLRLVGVSAKLALLRGPRRLVLVRLSDGRLASLPLRPAAAKGVVDAGLTGSGLFYAYNLARGTSRGRVVFEPTARLLARF